MGIAVIIVLGVVAITVVSVLGDMATKIAQAKAKSKEAKGSVPSGEIETLKDRLALLEAQVEERDDAVRKLQDEVNFVSRMLEDKTNGGKPSASGSSESGAQL
jgi:hypothetical protein